MLINIQADNESSTSGVKASLMQFDTRKQAKLFHMLSSSLYSDKPGSIIRELCSNCHDSHIVAGCLDTPFVMTGPTFENPFLSVKDFGVGLTSAEAEETILCYLGSSKDTSSEFIGGWGIGSKSPFAYAKNYNVIVIKNGVRAEFTCWKDAHGLPSHALISEEATDEPNGVEMIVPIEPEDVRLFSDAITDYMRWTNYNVTTTVGDKVVEHRKPIEVVDRGDYVLELFEKGSGAIRLVYGGQPYNIEDCLDNRYDYTSDWKRLQEAMSGEYDIAVVVNTPGAIDFNMNREELEQTEKSLNFVKEVVTYLSEEGQKHSQAYAREADEWKKNMMQSRQDSGTTYDLRDVSDMFDKALAAGENTDRFFGKAFRIFDYKIRVDLHGIAHRLTTHSGVTRIHSLQLVVAELHTQIEFRYGRLTGMTVAQRRHASQSIHKGREAIYVKAPTREEFDRFISSSPDFSRLDMSKFEVSFVEFPVKVSVPRAASARDPKPRIYCTTLKSYLTFHSANTYLVCTEEQRQHIRDSTCDDFELIVALLGGRRIQGFVPTTDFMKKFNAGAFPDNIMTFDAYMAANKPRAEKRVAKNGSLYSSRLHRLDAIVSSLHEVMWAGLPLRLSDKVEELAGDLANAVSNATKIQESIGIHKLLKLTGGRRDNSYRDYMRKATALINDSREIAKVSRYVNLAKLDRDYDSEGGPAKELVTLLGIAKHFE